MFKRRARVLLGLLLAASATLLLAGFHSHYGASIRASSSSYYSDYLYGSRFRLGGGHYQVLYRPRGYGSGYYFVSTYLSGARGCGRFCYSRGNTHYHHASCGHFRGYASRYGYGVNQLIGSYGPRR